MTQTLWKLQFFDKSRNVWEDSVFAPTEDIGEAEKQSNLNTRNTGMPYRVIEALTAESSNA